MLYYDAIVLGTGGVGSAALFHLAKRGIRALGIDRFEIGHDRGSSHGRTRIMRQAYFEHPNYVPMALRSYELWRQLEADIGEQLFHEVGLLQFGPPQGNLLNGVRASAAEHGLVIESLAGDEVAKRFPGFQVPSHYGAIFERQAGYLLVERCVEAHASLAQRLGAELRASEAVKSWRQVGGSIEVRTDRETYCCERLIVTVGAWASQLLGDMGVSLTVLRKPLFWWPTKSDVYQASRASPTFLAETDAGYFYGFPQIDAAGVKVAEHSGGSVVGDPLELDREIQSGEEGRVRHFNQEFLPGLGDEMLDACVCMYTMTADENFIVDRHPGHESVALAAGLSGHGFKFAPVLGEALVELVLDDRTTLPLNFLSARRPALRKP